MKKLLLLLLLLGCHHAPVPHDASVDEMEIHEIMNGRLAITGTINGWEAGNIRFVDISKEWHIEKHHPLMVFGKHHEELLTVRADGTVLVHGRKVAKDPAIARVIRCNYGACKEKRP